MNAIKRTLSIILLALAACLAASCDKNNNGIGNQIIYSPQGTLVYSGTCAAFGEETDEAKIYYVKEEDIYYVAFFYSGAGAFDFKWNKETNELEVHESITGLYYGDFVITILSQSEYVAYAGAVAQRSYYNPDTGTFYFHVLMESAYPDSTVFQETQDITFRIKD